MPRIIPTDIQNSLQTSQVTTRTLLEIYLLQDTVPLATMQNIQSQYLQVSEGLSTSGDYYVFRFVANDVQNLVLPSNNADSTRAGLTYFAADIDRGKIETNIDGSIEKCDIKMSNKWQTWSAIVANLGNVLLNRPCNILEYFPDYPAEAPVVVFSGAMNEIKMTASQFQWSVKRSVVDFNEQSPNMNYDVNCQYSFMDERCKFTGLQLTCDGVMSTCIAYGNVANFGGHPSVPRAMVIR